MLSPALADRQQPDPFWLTAYTRQEAGAQQGDRSIYFCGRAPFPGGTQVMVFLRFKGRVFNATQVQVGQTSSGFSQARAMMGDGAGGVNFGGKLGPIRSMALGEWELVCIVDRGGKSHRTSYSLVVGEVGQILALEGKVALRLRGRLKQLQEAFGRVKQRAEQYATAAWSETADREWRIAAQKDEALLRAISDAALAERAGALAPLFPFVQTILTQMPIKIRDLAANHYFALRESKGGAPKPQFDRKEVIARLEGEIAANLQRAFASLEARSRTTQEGLYLDLAKLENLVRELERQQRRAGGSSSFSAPLWNGMLGNGQRAVSFLRRKLEGYRKSDFGRAAPETIDLFEKALGLYQTLAARWSAGLYSRHSVRGEDRLPFAQSLLADRREPRALQKELNDALSRVREIAHRTRLELRRELLAQLGVLLASLDEILAGYAAAGKGGAVAFSAMLGPIKQKLGKLGDAAGAALDEKRLLYFPAAAHGVPALAAGVVSLGEEIEKLLTMGAQGEMKAHGYKVKYDRKEVIAMRANSGVSQACDLYRELELRDYRALERALSYFGRLQIPLDPLVKQKLAALPR